MFEIINLHGEPFKRSEEHTNGEIANHRRKRAPRTERPINWFSALSLLAVAAVAGSAFVWCGQRFLFLEERAKHGEPEAQYRLGLAAYKQARTPAEYDVALGWLRKAGAHEHPDAQAALGLVYAKGHGPGRNLVEARRWFGLAAENTRKAQELVFLPFGIPQKANVLLNWGRSLEPQGAEVARKNLKMAELADVKSRELTTRDGVKYHGVRVQDVGPDAMTIAFISEKGGPGLAKLKREALPDSLACVCGYTTDKNVTPFTLWAQLPANNRRAAKL